MESEQLLAQRKVLQNQVFSGSKRTRKPAEQVTNYQNHHEILVDDLKSADRQVIDSAGLRSFGEAQDGGSTAQSRAPHVFPISDHGGDVSQVDVVAGGRVIKLAVPYVVTAILLGSISLSSLPQRT